MSTEYSTDLATFLPEERSGAAREERHLNFGRLFRLRLPLMAGLFVAVAVPGMIAAYLATPPEYEATQTIQFFAKTPTILGNEGQRQLSANYEKYINTQVNLIIDNSILTRVLNEPEVQALAWLKAEPDKLEFLQRKVGARIQRGTELVTVSCRAKDREAAITVVKNIVDQYTKFATGRARTSDSERFAQLQKLRSDREAELNLQRERLSALYKEAGIPFGSKSDAHISEMQSYHENLTKAKAERSTAETQLRGYEEILRLAEELQAQFKKNPDAPLYGLNIEDKVLSSSVVGIVRGELAKVEQEIAVSKDRYQPDAPQLKVLTDSRESLTNQANKVMREARAEALESVMETVRQAAAQAQRSVEDAKRRETEFQKYIDDNRDQLIEAKKREMMIEELKQNIADTQGKLKQAEDQSYQIDVESNAPAGFQVPSEVSADVEPKSDKRLQFMALALVGGLGLGFCGGVWRELTDQKLRTAQDVASVTHLPVLAAVPHASVDQMPVPAHGPLLTVDYPGSTIADEYRRVITRIIYPPEGSAELNTCLVVSPSRGDGKTSVACNLAIALAEANRRVLLLDIASRAPAVEIALGLEPAAGLSEILCDGALGAEFMRPATHPNLMTLGPGHHAQELIGKLASREMVDFLERAEQAFEHVIIDTPPSLLMADAKLLAPVVDGLVVVAGVETSNLGMLRRCLVELQQVGANIVGIVLNGVLPTRGGYLKENRDLYYAYSDSEKAFAAAPRRQAVPMEAVADAEDDPPVIMLLDENDENKTKDAGA